MYIGLFRHDISGVQSTSVKVSGTPERSKGAEVMWTGWTVRCGLFSRNNVLWCPQNLLSQVSQRWVRGWVSVFVHVCLGNRKESSQNIQNWQHFSHAFLGFDYMLFTLDKCKENLNITYWQMHQRFCSACCEITPTKTIRQTETAWDKNR